ncbi:MAG TPA: hypothetical protein PLQ56_21095 [Aggregatilineales bacterium]|nr:hypothetical protein [Aggregatilineales bacterium]
MKSRKRKDQDEHQSGLCAACDLQHPLNEQELCQECAGKLERDLIRTREWEYSYAALLTPERQAALRTEIIREFGAANELLTVQKPKPRNKHSRSVNTRRKRTIAAAAVRDYNTEDVLQAARSFLEAQNEEWVNVSRLAQHIYERFYKLKPKHLRQPGKRYKSILKFLADMPDFVIRRDPENDVYWIRRTAASDAASHCD